MKREAGTYSCEFLQCCTCIFLMLPFFCSLQFRANDEENSNEEIFDKSFHGTLGRKWSVLCYLYSNFTHFLIHNRKSRGRNQSTRSL